MPAGPLPATRGSMAASEAERSKMAEAAGLCKRELERHAALPPRSIGKAAAALLKASSAALTSERGLHVRGLPAETERREQPLPRADLRRDARVQAEGRASGRRRLLGVLQRRGRAQAGQASRRAFAGGAASGGALLARRGRRLTCMRWASPPHFMHSPPSCGSEITCCGGRRGGRVKLEVVGANTRKCRRSAAGAGARNKHGLPAPQQQAVTWEIRKHGRVIPEGPWTGKRIRTPHKTHTCTHTHACMHAHTHT